MADRTNRLNAGDNGKAGLGADVEPGRQWGQADPVAASREGNQPSPGASPDGKRSGIPDAVHASLTPDPLEAVLNNLSRFPDEYGVQSDPMKAAHPALWALLARVHLPNGKSKEPARISLSLGPVGVEATLTDVSLGYKLVIACEHVQDVFRVFEAAIHSPSAKWLPLRFGEGYQDRKRREREEVDKRREKR